MNYPEDFINKIICGNCLEVMKEMPDECIDMCLCSPPYWGLRDYGVEQIFGGALGCKHKWKADSVPGEKSGKPGPNATVGARFAQDAVRRRKPTNKCQKCHAWKGQIGLEQTPEFYIEHLTEIFSEVKRVLKKDGVFFLNMGDSYATVSGRQGKDDLYEKQPKYSKDANKAMPIQWKIDLPQKCLCMIPERLAWSLIQNGWILRNKIPWIKENSMPESVKDRFSRKWEYVFYFVKSQSNYFDLDAIREPHKTPNGMGWANKKGKKYSTSYYGNHRGMADFSRKGEGLQAMGGNPLGKNPGDIWVINTTPCPVKGTHFATFPEELCKKAIIPGCPEGGIVLDPFAGIGTTGYVARKLGRKFIMIDIKKEYCDKAENKRLAQGVL